MYGSFIRRVRESRGLSQSDVAEITGIPQPSLSAYERDRRLPTADTLNRILAGCGYVLEAVAGPRRIICTVPRVGWFPDDAWRPEIGEETVPTEPPTFAPDTDPMVRAAHIEAVLALGDALREAKTLGSEHYALRVDKKVKNDTRVATRVSTKHQVTIPVSAFDDAGLAVGDRLVARSVGAGKVLLERVDSVVDAFAGAQTGVWEEGELDRLRDEWD